MMVQFPCVFPVAPGCFDDITNILIVPTAAAPSVARHDRPSVVWLVVRKVMGVVVSITRVSSSDANETI